MSFDDDGTQDDGAGFLAEPIRFWGGDEEGPGAQTVADYPLTPDELLVLVRHWYKESLEDAIFTFLYGCLGNWEIGAYANKRITRIELLLGKKAIQEVINKVNAEERERLGAETWRIFTEGDGTERARVRDDVEQSHLCLDAKRADDVTCRAAFAFLARHPTEVYSDSVGDLWYLTESSSTPSQLLLKVRTKNGSSANAVNYRLARPPAWFAPFGLH